MGLTELEHCHNFNQIASYLEAVVSRLLLSKMVKCSPTAACSSYIPELIYVMNI